MRPFFWMRPLALLAALALAAPVPTAAAGLELSSIRVDAQPTGGAELVAQFGGGTAPKPQVVGAGTTQVAILLANVSLGPLVPPTLAGTGPITGVSVSQSGSNATIFVRLAQPVAVQVREAGVVLFVDIAGPPGGAFGALTQAMQPTPQPIGADSVTEIVSLKYADVSEIAGVLVQGSNVASNDNFSPTQTSLGTNSLGSSGSFGGVSSFGSQAPAVQSFGGGFGAQNNGLAQRLNDNIAIDRRLNAIILTGTPDVVAQYKSLIERIDVPVQSVILDTEIVEIDDSVSKDVGFDFAPAGDGVVVNGSPSTTVGTSGSSNGLVIRQGSESELQFSLAANLHAQITLGNARVISKPRILAQSGQPASILTGDAIPIVTSVVVTGGSAITSQQVNYVNVGVNLQIQPRVSSDGYITSHIYSEVSSVTAYVAGIPEISQRTASTIATVKDGESFVIGGLLQDNEIKSLTKLPFIGDLPLIGVFFQHINNTHNRTNLYIVVTPHVVGRTGFPPAAGVAPAAIPSAAPALAPGLPPGFKSGP